MATNSNKNLSDFRYADCDEHNAELSELYSYSEVDDFVLCFEAFCHYMNSRKEKNIVWFTLNAASKLHIMHDLTQRLESADADVRLNAARILLYILQGSFYDFANENECEEQYKIEIFDSDCDATQRREYRNIFHKVGQFLKMSSDMEDSPDNEDKRPERGTGGYEGNCLLNAAINSYYAYESGLLQPLCTMLAIERDESSKKHLFKQQSVSSLNSSSSALGTNTNTRRSATLADNESLRVVINCLYHIVESIRREELIPKIVEFCKLKQAEAYDGGLSFTSMYTEERLKQLRENFVVELDEPLDSPKVTLVILLFDMIPDFVRGKCPHYPIKKMLLLTWKVLLVTLGDLKFLKEEKTQKREQAGLSSIEDTLEIANMLKPVIYGNENEADTFISRLSRFNGKDSKIRALELGKSRFLNRQSACVSGDKDKRNDSDDYDGGDEDKSNENPIIEDDDEALSDDAFQAEDEIVPNSTLETPNTPKAKGDMNDKVFDFVDDKAVTLADTFTIETPDLVDLKEAGLKLRLEAATIRKPKGTVFCRKYNNSSNNEFTGDQTPRAGSPVPGQLSSLHLVSLPWKTKVRAKDLENFLQKERRKYFGYQLDDDSSTMFGLPVPVIQSVDAFKRNIYVSLGDLQIESDEKFNKFQFSKVEFIEETKTERLYRRMLPNMTEYVMALLKVILASLPSSKAKSDAVSILSDLLIPETDTNEMLSNSMSLDVSGQNMLEETVLFAIDINRHKELIVKASSAIIIMLLKFFRLNHIYQFENFAQYLVLANCLPLVLKFIDQNVLRYMQSKHEISPLNYPRCALHYVRNGGNFPMLTADNVYEVDTEAPSYFLWRNVFSSINLLRVLNKLTKWKHARTMMLVVFKSAPVLKRCMRIHLGIFQLYVLKLLKMQARFLGRQWRKSNMDIISSIYMIVRHRLNDDWAFANETRSKSWDFQAEEAELGISVKRFNRRRYKQLLNNPALANDKCESEHACNNCNAQQNDQLINRINLRSEIPDDSEKFNNRSCGVGDNSILDGDLFAGIDAREFEPVNNCLQSLLSWEPKFSERFLRNYSKWVDEEVIRHNIDWDTLLENTRGIAFTEQF